MPDRYWGNLLEAAPLSKVACCLTRATTGVAPWPWPAIGPDDFEGTTLDGWWYLRRVMSAAEAGVLGLSRNGGVVQRIYLLGPDGATIYSFSLWPMLPDEAS